MRSSSLAGSALTAKYWERPPAADIEKLVQANPRAPGLMQAEFERYMKHAIGHRLPDMGYATTMHR